MFLFLCFFVFVIFLCFFFVFFFFFFSSRRRHTRCGRDWSSDVCSSDLDDVSIVPTFFIAPLTYLGGVFYSISLLPEFWQKVSLLNPILHLVNTFRYGVLGVSDINIMVALSKLVVFVVLLTLWSLWLLNKGTGLRK